MLLQPKSSSAVPTGLHKQTPCIGCHRCGRTKEKFRTYAPCTTLSQLTVLNNPFAARKVAILQDRRYAHLKACINEALGTQHSWLISMTHARTKTRTRSRRPCCGQVFEWYGTVILDMVYVRFSFYLIGALFEHVS